MKYMGSKRAMLTNGLGELLSEKIKGADRFIDLFAGSAAVATHVACKYDVPVLAYDLQEFSVVLANAVLRRQESLDWRSIWTNWRARACRIWSKVPVPGAGRFSASAVQKCRRWCATQSDLPITRAYGGHYFSPTQSVWIDALRFTLPDDEPKRTVALAALIDAASQCAAAPGHTAQPFQPTLTAKQFLKEAWERDLGSGPINSLAMMTNG